MKSIFDAIKAERNFQDAKWGEQNHNTFTWMSILMEEVSEARKASLEAYKSHKRTGVVNNPFLSVYLRELIRVAAIAVAAIESLKRNELIWGDGECHLYQDFRYMWE